MNGLNCEPSICNILAEADDQGTVSLINESKYYKLSNLDELAQFGSSESRLSLFNTNSRSLIKHHSQFQAVFHAIENGGVIFDVITFCETWLDDNLSPAVEFSNYTPIFKHKHRLRSSIPSAPACKGGPANLLVACWTVKQWVQDTKKILAKKIVMIGHEFHYDQ